MSGPTITDEVRAIAALVPDRRNARRHPAAQVAQIARAIDEFGFINRIVVRPDGRIIGGHATVEALKQLGRQDAECRVVAGLTDAQYKRLALALNKLPEGSDWDSDMLAEIIGELDAAGEDLDGMGFSRTELDKLMAEPDALEVREIETGPVDDEFWISVRGDLKHQAAVLKALEEAMKPFAGVSVDLGTISIG